MVVAIGAYAPVFTRPDSLIGVLNDTGFLFMMALAQMMVILTRGIDLSVAANLALTGMLTRHVRPAQPDAPVIVFIGLSLLIGLGLGLINGSLIAFLGIPPIVVTLGTLAIYPGDDLGRGWRRSGERAARWAPIFQSSSPS